MWWNNGAGRAAFEPGANYTMEDCSFGWLAVVRHLDVAAKQLRRSVVVVLVLVQMVVVVVVVVVQVELETVVGQVGNRKQSALRLAGWCT